MQDCVSMRIIAYAYTSEIPHTEGIGEYSIHVPNVSGIQALAVYAAQHVGSIRHADGQPVKYKVSNTPGNLLEIYKVSWKLV